MARFQGAKEKLHLPIYDAFFVPGAKNNTTNGTQPKKFEEMMTDPRALRFFVDVQNKTRLETNLQAAGVLPSLNTFEARAMRVVVSTTFRAAIDRATILAVIQSFNCPMGDEPTRNKFVRQVIQTIVNTQAILDAADAYCNTDLTLADQDKLVRRIESEFERAIAAASTAASGILAELIYNSVTTLLVGEKIMIEMPTYWFPSGAGVSPGNGTVTNHGEPDPMATFRFAEPVFIEPQQNFRVEMLFPQGVPDAVRSALGPLRIWVVLDGYLTRDVQ